MRIAEEAVVMACQGETLVGVLSRPAGSDAGHLGLVLIVGGPQYRVGSHRQFTMLAREAAAQGTPVLRFDYRGMGDSTGDVRNFEAIDDDIASAIDALQLLAPQVRRVVLWGLCDGASAALMYWDRRRDPRVAGMCLLNPWVRSAVTLARAHVKHYYLQRLTQSDFWRKLLSGQVAGQALGELRKNLKLAARSSVGVGTDDGGSFQQRMATGADAFKGPLLVMLSGDDYTAKEFMESIPRYAQWQACFRRDNVQRLPMEGADHTFSSPAAGQAMQAATVRWLREATFELTTA